jgi:hypothetical protein
MFCTWGIADMQISCWISDKQVWLKLTNPVYTEFVAEQSTYANCIQKQNCPPPHTSRLQLFSIDGEMADKSSKWDTRTEPIRRSGSSSIELPCNTQENPRNPVTETLEPQQEDIKGSKSASFDICSLDQFTWC